jgi:hypothetical protein
LDTAQRVLPIPFRLIEKALRDIGCHERPPDSNVPRRRLSYAPVVDIRINDPLNNLSY